MPCGTPEPTSIRLDCLSSTTTLCFLFLENYKSITKFSHRCRGSNNHEVPCPKLLRSLKFDFIFCCAFELGPERWLLIEFHMIFLT